eukprot:1137151-Pelagomonas_calceolata.AAC.1
MEKLTLIALALLSSDAQTLIALILRLIVNYVHNNAKLAPVAVFNACLLLNTTVEEWAGTRPACSSSSSSSNACSNSCSNARNNACSNAHSNACSSEQSNACSNEHSNACNNFAPIKRMHSRLHVHHGIL